MQPDFSNDDELVRARFFEAEGVSLSVGVSLGGKTVYEQSFGKANIESNHLATPDTPYSVASVSKPILGTALAIMIQEGKIDLHEPANRYLTGAQLRALEGQADGATIARLANHTSGLPTHYQFITEDDGPAPTGEETISRYGNLTRPPGEAYNYANLGFGFLGSAIENQSGMRLPEFFEERIFRPLGMSSSFLLDEPIHPEGAAMRYDEKHNRLPAYITVHPGASDVYASVRDLLRFGESHFGHVSSPILRQETIRRMHEPTGSATIEQIFGITWVRRHTVSGDLVIGHSGGMAGVSTRMLIVPSRSLVFVTLCNFESSLGDDVLDILLKTAGAELCAPQPQAATESLLAEAVGAWRGKIITYAGECPVCLTVRKDGTVCADDAETDAKFENNQIVGTVDGQIPTPDAARIEHKMALDLQYRGDRLTGSVSALTVDGARVRNRIAYPAHLDRA